jgi:hypothetical protein
MTTTPNRTEQKFVIPMPLLGLNTLDNSTQMDPLFATDLSNVELDILGGYAKRSGFTRFNTGMLPITITGSISGITGTHVGGATAGLIWSGVVTAGMIFRMASGSNLYQISNVITNAALGLVSSYADTVTTGSYYISCPGVDGLYPYMSGTVQKLIAFGGGTMFDGGSSATGEFVNLWASLKDGAQVSAVNYQDKLYFCNGYQYQVYNGVTVATVGGSPVPSDPKYITKYIIGNATYLVVCGSNTDADRSRLSFSDVNAPATYPVANRYQVGEGDGGEVIGAMQCPNGLLVFKTNGIFMFGGVPGASGSLSRLSDISCSSPKTIKLYKGYVLFVGSDKGKLGVYMYVGGNQIDYLSRVVEPSIDNVDKLFLSDITAEIYNNKYILSANSGTDHNNACAEFYLDRITLDSNGRIVSPCVTANIGRKCFANVTILGDDYLFGGSSTSGYIYQEFNGITDDTTDNLMGNTAAIDAYITTKDFDFGRIDVNKELLRAYSNLSSLGAWDLNLDLYTDFSSYGYTRYLIDMEVSTLTWATVVFLVTPWQSAVEQKVNEIRFLYPSIAKFFRFKLSNSGESQYFSAFPMTVYYKDESR